MRYIGIDLHPNCFTVCIGQENGQSRLRDYRLSELKAFQKTLRATDWLAVEATGNVRFFRDAVAPCVARCVVVDPGQFEVIKKSVKKTDKNDAQLLAWFLSKDMLPEARMKDKRHAPMSSLVNTRNKLVKLRTTLINKIHGILVAQGIKSRKEAYSSDVGLQRVLDMAFDEIVHIELEVIVTQIRHLNEGIKKLDEQIKTRGPQLKGHENLKSIKGIGDQSAAILLSVIGDVNDFANEGKLASYFGIVPRVAQSNETLHLGRITKKGSTLGRTALVQCTLVAKRYSPYLQRFYTRIQKKRGSGKAIIATARKFLGIIYRTLKNNWIFEDFPNFVLAKKQAS